MINTYDIEINQNDEIITLSLRLTIGGQVALKKKFGGNALGTILEASDDAEKCAAVLKEALNFKGNTNKITDGFELYDLLVDNGYKDYESFGNLLLSIACVSGLITEEKKQKLLNSMLGSFDKMFEGLEDDEPKNQ